MNSHRQRKRFLDTLLSRLESDLADAGFEVWLDRSRLGPGDEFEGRLHFALQSCDAAVVLIDLDALDSGYVRKEATILMWRRMTDGIDVLPVLLGRVTERDLASSALGDPVGLSR